MSGMISGIDHIALAVRDLESSIVAYRSLLGREPNWVGGDGGARHAWFQLETMALDVIAPQGAGEFGDMICRHLEDHGEGVWALAFAVADVAAAARLMTRRGLRASPPASTRSTHRDGRKRYWTTTALDLGDTAGVRLLLVDPPRNGEQWPRSPIVGHAPASVSELDHVVVQTSQPERALAIYGARLGLDLRLDRSNERWGVRQLFFRCGASVVEVATSLRSPTPLPRDQVGELDWRLADAGAAQERLARLGFDASEVRTGRKPGSRVFTVRSGVVGAPSLFIEQNAAAPEV